MMGDGGGVEVGGGGGHFFTTIWRGHQFFTVNI